MHGQSECPFCSKAIRSPWKYFSRSLRVSNARLKEVSNWKPDVKSVAEGWPLVAAELHLANQKRHLVRTF